MQAPVTAAVPPVFDDGSRQIYCGDCLEVMAAMEPSSIDTVLCDPPYGLEFMGKEWDKLWTKRDKRTADLTARQSTSPFIAAAVERYVGGKTAQTWHEAWARAALRVAKPGAMLFAFGGTRTWHRLACAIEDSGWELRDTCMFLYGSGFPKSLAIDKAIDKAAGAEREVVETIPDRWAGKGTVLCRANQEEAESVDITAPSTDAAKDWQGWGTALKPAWEPILVAMKPLDGTFAQNAQKHGVAGLNIDGARIGTSKRVPASPRGGQDRIYGKYGAQTGEESGHDSNLGRWPAKLVLDEEAARQLDEASGVLSTGAMTAKQQEHGGFGGSKHCYGDSARGGVGDVSASTGGASRFFYTSKASGLDRVEGNDHPTVKPLSLMRWLCRLTATPTGGVILDPFMGSGSTLLAAKEEGRKCIGIELDAHYCEIAERRLAQGVLFDDA